MTSGGVGALWEGNFQRLSEVQEHVSVKSLEDRPVIIGSNHSADVFPWVSEQHDSKTMFFGRDFGLQCILPYVFF